MGNLLGAFKAPTPDEVDEHHAGTRGLGEEKLVWRQPFLKIGGDGQGLPEVPGEDNVHIAKAVDTLGRYSDPGDHPRWTARDIGAEGGVALARTRDMLRQLGEKSPELADAYLRKLFTFPLPQGTREALTGGPEPERIPVGVFKDEWEKRRKPDIAFEPLDKTDQGGCAVPMVYRPGEVYDCKLGGWRRETPEDQAKNGPRWMLEGGPEGADIGAGTDVGDGAGHDQPGSPTDGKPSPADDPEAREREARVERILRRRAERSGEDPDEAVRRHWAAEEHGQDGGDVGTLPNFETGAGGQNPASPEAKPDAVPTKPDWENYPQPQSIKKEYLDGFKQSLQANKDLNDHERYTFLMTFDHEGGSPIDPNGGGDGIPTSSGLTGKTLAGLNLDHGANLPTDPAKLTMEQRVQAYKLIADDALRHIKNGLPGPGPTLDAFRDPKAAQQFLDVTFQHGFKSRAGIVQGGINSAVMTIPAEVRKVLGIAPVEIDPKGGIGQKTRDMMFRIIDAGYGSALRSAIADQRDRFWGGNPTGNNKRRIDATR